jgi:hypothetical protein
VDNISIPEYPESDYPATKRQRFVAFRQTEAKRIEDYLEQNPDHIFIMNGEMQAVVPVIKPEDQDAATEMCVPDPGEEARFYVQPPNRQYFRRAFKALERGQRSAARKEFVDSIKHKPNPNPTKLPTHLIREIYCKRNISIHHKQYQSPRRGKLIAAHRKTQENYNRWVNQHAS